MGASVTNLRRWREERNTSRAELLESRDNSPRWVGETRLSGWLDRLTGRAIEWYLEPPQVRSIAVGDDVVRLAFPYMLFGVQQKRDGTFVSLHAFATVDPFENPLDQVNIGGTHMWLLPLPNVIGHTASVCFGDFKDEIVSGELDPIDAFWSSRFNFDATSDWKRPAMKRWARATKTASRQPPASLDLSAREKFWAIVAVRAMKTCMRVSETTPSTVLKRFLIERSIQVAVSCAIVALGFMFIYALARMLFQLFR